MTDQFLSIAIREFRRYQALGEKTMEQLPDGALFWQYNDASNAIATIIKHLSGNMLSRWTAIFETDGEKPWRNRDEEFVNELLTREALMALWQNGWARLYETLDSLDEADLGRVIYIRKEAHSVTEAIVRQVAHYASHVGQIQFIGKMYLNNKWTSLSIPPNGSQEFNNDMFSRGG